MKKHQVTAAAILGLAFGSNGVSIAQNVLSGTGEDVFSAVNGADSPSTSASTEDEPTTGASGAPVVPEEVKDNFLGASVASGNVNTDVMSATVLSSCAGGSNVGTQFQNDCTTLVAGGTTDPTATTNAVSSLTPDQIAAQNAAAIQQVKAGVAVAGTRMSGLRLASGISGFAPNEAIAANLLYSQLSGGGASGDAQSGPLGAFFNIKYLNGKQDRDQFTSGYDLDGLSFSVGVDYRVTENMIAGVLGSYMNGSVDYKQNKGDMDADGWSLAAYGTYFWNGGGFLEGIAGYALNNYDLNRRIQYSIDVGDKVDNVNQTATSSPGANIFFTSLGGGYNFNRGSFTITPQASLNYVHNDVDSYQDKMSDPTGPGGSLAIAVDSQTYTSLTSRLGLMLAKAISSSQGVFVPQLTVTWVHEFQNDQEQVGARFASDLSHTPFFIATSKPDRNYFDIGIGLSGQFAHGRSGFITINSLVGYQDVDYYEITGGFRMEF